MTYRTPIVTLKKVETLDHYVGTGKYLITSISFIDSMGRGHSIFEYTMPDKPHTGREIFELVEALAHNNNYKLARVRDFGLNIPRIVVQYVENPGIFSVPYSL